MFVVQIERIRPDVPERFRVLGAARLVAFDQPAPAAGVSRDGMARQVRAVGQDSGIDERAGEENEPGRIAARIADPRRFSDPLALMRVELGQPVDPAACDPVRGARIEHPHVVARYEAHRLARRVIGKAEDHDVGLVEIPAAHLRILAQRLRNLDERDIPAPREPFADLKPGRARLPVDEYVRHRLEPCTAHPVSGERTANPDHERLSKTMASSQLDDPEPRPSSVITSLQLRDRRIAGIGFGSRQRHVDQQVIAAHDGLVRVP